jgi:hypothetical protein
MNLNSQTDVALRFTWLGKCALLILIVFIGIAVVIKSFDYYTPDFSKGYLSDKENAFDGIFKYGLYAHIISVPVIFFIGTLQAFFRYEIHYPRVHRVAGSVYVCTILFISFPGALVLSFYAFGGLASKMSFILLSLLWGYCTYKGWHYGKNRMFNEHKKFMIRSYVLTTSAIMLRILSFVSMHYLHFSGENAYVFIAWGSWLPAIVLTEFIFYKNSFHQACND